MILIFAGIRSLVSVDNLLTMGTGNGLIRFYDMAANRFLTCSCGVDWTLEAGNGRLVSTTSLINKFLGALKFWAFDFNQMQLIRKCIMNPNHSRFNYQITSWKLVDLFVERKIIILAQVSVM